MAKKQPETEATPEADQPKATKAQAIRDALAADPKGMPKDVAAKLSIEGWNVTANEVSQAKYVLKAKKKVKKKAAAKTAEAAPAAAVPADLVSVAALQKAKKLIQELGGVKEAKQALAALSQLLD